MRARDIIGNIRGRLSNQRNVEPRVFPDQENNSTEEYSNPVQTTSELRQYFQWYEDTPERLQFEQERMQEEFPEFKCCKLNDARICFTGKMIEHEIAFVCGYNYPREPAEALLISGELSSKFVSPDGVIDVFGSGDIEWDANTTFIVDIAKQIRTMLGLLSSVKDECAREKINEPNDQR